MFLRAMRLAAPTCAIASRGLEHASTGHVVTQAARLGRVAQDSASTFATAVPSMIAHVPSSAMHMRAALPTPHRLASAGFSQQHIRTMSTMPPPGDDTHRASGFKMGPVPWGMLTYLGLAALSIALPGLGQPAGDKGSNGTGQYKRSTDGTAKGQGVGSVAAGSGDAPTPLSINGVDRFSSIIVGGGTAGCFVAYFLAKWMQELGVPGKVVLIERGDDYIPAFEPKAMLAGPDPSLLGWDRNWGNFGEAHETLERRQSSTDPKGTLVPYEGPTASDHKGLGGCGSHDTRITFMPTDEQRARMAKAMGWTREQIDVYFQTVLDVIPLTRAVQEGEKARKDGEKFYDAVIDVLSHVSGMVRMTGDEFKAQTLRNAVGYVSVAMYKDETRWTSALLMQEGVRPKNLVVLTRSEFDRVIIAEKPPSEGGARSLVATGVLVRVGDKAHVINLDEAGEVAITAGALGTPAGLHRSGIGPKAVLDRCGIPLVVDNPEVGHGVDHIEAPVQFEFEDAWRNPETGALPRGGAMGWPIVIFKKLERLNHLIMQAHGGVGAWPYPEGVMVFSPNCTQPNPNQGFDVEVTSADPRVPSRVVHRDSTGDTLVLAEAVREMVKLGHVLYKAGVVGKRLEPGPGVDVENDEQLCKWIVENRYTVFHWMSTCRAGVLSKVADEHFRVRAPDAVDGVVHNLRVGSGAALPEISEANPHLTISAFSAALADDLLRTQAEFHHIPYRAPAEMAAAKATLAANDGQHVIRRDGDEKPRKAAVVAAMHRIAWEKANKQSS